MFHKTVQYFLIYLTVHLKEYIDAALTMTALHVYHLGANLSNFCLALTLGPAQSYPLICSIGEKYKTYWKVLRGHQHNRQPIKLTTLAFSCLSMSSTFYPSFKLAPFSQQSCVRSTTSCLGRLGQHSFADVGGKGRGRYVGRPLIEGGLQSPT